MTTNTEYKIDPQEIVQSFFDEPSFELFKSKMNSRFNKLSGEERQQLRMLTAELVGRAFYTINEMRNLGCDNQSICDRFATCLDFISGKTKEFSRDCESYQSKRTSQVKEFKSVDRDIKDIPVMSIQKAIVITGAGATGGYALGKFISTAAVVGRLEESAETVHATYKEKDVTQTRFKDSVLKYGEAEKELEAFKKKEIRKILYSTVVPADFKKHGQLYHKKEQTLAEHNAARLAFRNASATADAAWKEYTDLHASALNKKAAAKWAGMVAGGMVAAGLSKAVLGVFNCLFIESCKAPGLTPETRREPPFYSGLPGPESFPYPEEHAP